MNNGMNYGGYGYQQNQGQMIPGMSPSAEFINGYKVASWLTPEESNTIKKSEGFQLQVTNEESIRAMCNHRTDDGVPSIRDEADGSCTCRLCGYNFHITENLTKEEVENATNVIENILQTTKLLYISMDPSVGRQYFQIIAFLRKMPKLYELAANDYKKYDRVNGFYQGVPANAFAIFGSLTNPAISGYQQPMAPQFTGQPGWGQQHPMNPFYANQAMNPPTTPQGWGQQPPNPQGWGQQPPNPQGWGQQPPNPQGWGQQPPNPQMAPGQGAPANNGYVLSPQGSAAPAPQQTPPANTSGSTTEQATVGGDYKA